MPRTRVVMQRMPNNNFNNRRFVAARAAMNAAMGNRNRGRRSNFKITFLLLQGRGVEVKDHGRVVRQMRVLRKAIFPAVVRERRYPRN